MSYLIITNEACFWNHGDHTDWLFDNKTFQMKTELLDSANICVWRNYDFIHSCMKLEDGRSDNEILKEMEENNFDTLITLECTDYTVAEYVRDSTMLGRNKTIIALGHFSQEEAGMEYMIHYLPDIVGKEVPCTFVKTTDMFVYQK